MAIILREREGKIRKSGKYAGKKITTFYLEFNINGNRWTETLPIRHIPGVTKKKAQREAANAIKVQKENDILTKNFEYIPKDIGEMLFIDQFELFIEDYRKADLRMFKGALRYFKAFLEDEDYNAKLLTLNALNPELCKRFADYLKTSNLRGETPHNYFQRFNRILKHLARKKYISENPVDQLAIDDKIKKKASEDLEKEILRSDDLSKLLDTECGNAQVKDAFIFACFTGLGFAEIKKLTWKNVKNDWLRTERQKTGQKVSFPLPATAKKIISKYDRSSKLVFKLPSAMSVNKTLKKWVERAEVEKHITFYCARHSFAVMLLDKSKANLKTVADMMGHSDTTHTIRYLKHIEDSKKAAAENLPDIVID